MVETPPPATPTSGPPSLDIEADGSADGDFAEISRAGASPPRLHDQPEQPHAVLTKHQRIKALQGHQLRLQEEAKRVNAEIAALRQSEVHAIAAGRAPELEGEPLRQALQNVVAGRSIPPVSDDMLK